MSSEGKFWRKQGNYYESRYIKELQTRYSRFSHGFERLFSNIENLI